MVLQRALLCHIGPWVSRHGKCEECAAPRTLGKHELPGDENRATNAVFDLYATAKGFRTSAAGFADTSANYGGSV